MPDVEETCESHDPEYIAILHQQLSKVPVDELVNRLTLANLNELEIYSLAGDEYSSEYVKPYLEEFLSLLEIASENNFGIFVMIT